MKHKILILIVMCLFPLVAIKAQSFPFMNLSPGEVADCVSKMTGYKDKGDSAPEAFIKVIAKMKMEEVNYAYISTSMFKQIFSLYDEVAGANGNILSSIKSIRHFTTTGENGYKRLRAYMDVFLSEVDAVFGMELQMFNRTDDAYSAVYSDVNSLLVINDYGENVLSVVFVNGLSYEMFMNIQESGIPFFDF